MDKFNKCPICGCTDIVIEYGKELRCDNCDWLIAELINGKWITE